MKAVVATGREDWESFVAALPRAPFLQSWEWGEFQEAVGRTVERLLFVEDGEVLAAVQLLTHPLPLKRAYLFSPRGPVWTAGFARQSEVYELARRHVSATRRRIFWRLEPASGAVPVKAARVADVQPAVTQMLNLSLTEEELLTGMKQKTRYNCRLAEKKEVAVRFITAADQPDWQQQAADFWDLLTETSDRHGIRHHPRSYYETMIQHLGEAGLLEVARAEYQDQLLAINLMIGYGDTMTYVHGASSQREKQRMAPYALQWSAVQRAQGEGYEWYDFYGVAPAEATEHKLAGVTRFKTGFGGEAVTYPGTVDLPLRTSWYALYDIVRKLR